MSKLTNIYTEYVNRIDAALLPGGILEYFTGHQEANSGHNDKNLDYPYAITTVESIKKQNYDNADKNMALVIKTTVYSNKVDGYLNRTTGEGALADVENFINAVYKDYDFGSNADVDPTIEVNIQEVSEDTITHDVVFTFESRPFTPGFL